MKNTSVQLKYQISCLSCIFFFTCWITTFESLLNVLLMADVLISEVFTSLPYYWHWPQKCNANINPKKFCSSCLHYLIQCRFSLWRRPEDHPHRNLSQPVIWSTFCITFHMWIFKESAVMLCDTVTLLGTLWQIVCLFFFTFSVCVFISQYFLYERLRPYFFPHGADDSKGRTFLNWTEGFLLWSLRYVHYNEQNN